MVINPIIGFYIPIIRIPINGGMTIPNIATFDHGTFGCLGKPMRVFVVSYQIHSSNTGCQVLGGVNKNWWNE